MLFKALCFPYQLWEIAPEKHRPGRVEHTVGWPLVSGASKLNEFFLGVHLFTSFQGLDKPSSKLRHEENEGVKETPRTLLILCAKLLLCPLCFFFITSA